MGEQDLNLHELAGELGMNYSTLHKLMSGETGTPFAKTLRKLTQYVEMKEREVGLRRDATYLGSTVYNTPMALRETRAVRPATDLDHLLLRAAQSPELLHELITIPLNYTMPANRRAVALGMLADIRHRLREVGWPAPEGVTMLEQYFMKNVS